MPHSSPNEVHQARWPRAHRFDRPSLSRGVTTAGSDDGRFAYVGDAPSVESVSEGLEGRVDAAVFVELGRRHRNRMVPVDRRITAVRSRAT